MFAIVFRPSLFPRAFTLWLLLAPFIAPVSRAAQSDVPPPGSLAELLAFDDLPRRKSWTTHQASGYDRGGGFYDSGNFLRTEPGPRYVLMESTGPGCIDRLWFTSKAEFGQERYDLVIFIDDLREPLIRVNLDELFRGQRTPFVEPLAGICGNPRFPGRYSYVPIGFTNFARVELHPTADASAYVYRENSAGERIPHVYYQVTYRRLPAGAPVRAFSWELNASEQTQLNTIRATWGQRGVSPYAASPHLRSQPVAVDIPPSGEALLARIDRPGTLCGLRLQTPHPEGLQFAFTWDDAAEPAVLAPFGPFFGGADDASGREVRGLWMGRTDGWFYHWLPMPFHRSAQLRVRSSASVPARLTGEILVRSEPPPADAGRFHAHRYDDARPPRGADYMVLDTTGSGHFVGLVMDRPGNMEGDDRFYVDGERVPSLHGTGTEDFFNFAWGLSHTGAWPLHGITQQTVGPVAYRFHLPAGVPFQRSLRITWEHGHDLKRGPNLDERRYSGVVFYYRAPSASDQ